MSIFTYFAVLLSLTAQGWALELPSYLPKCCIKDPHLSECILNAANKIQPYIENGIKEINLPSLNPLVISKFDAIQNTESLNYTATLTNFAFHGMHNFIIKTVNYDPNTMKLTGVIEFPPMPISADYKVHGKVLYFDMIGKGSLTGAFGQMIAKFDINGELVTRKNVEYYKTKSVKIQLSIDDFGVNLSGLFGDNLELARITSNMINQNSKEIMKKVTPVYEEVFETNVLAYVNELTKEIPYSKIFPCA